MKLFEKKFGVDFISAVPVEPGVYRFFSEKGDILYVGKAKNLRKRLTQYRDTRRSRRHRKMKKIVNEAVRLEWEVLASDFDACLHELRLIQKLKPEFNVAGAYTFMYPFIGIRVREEVSFCFTTQPQSFTDFQMYGAFRSRETAGEAFFSLVRLLEFIGHKRKPSSKETIPDYSYLFHFRKLPMEWLASWDQFFRGSSKDVLEELILKLLQNAGARAKAGDIQDDVNALKRFWRIEAKPLALAIAATGYGSYPVAQNERDPLFLSYRVERE